MSVDVCVGVGVLVGVVVGGVPVGVGVKVGVGVGGVGVGVGVDVGEAAALEVRKRMATSKLSGAPSSHVLPSALV